MIVGRFLEEIPRVRVSCFRNAIEPPKMTLFFSLFALIALSGAIGVVAFKNPVTSAFSLIVSFLGLAALFIQLDAYLVGILQILVYAGAIMVLFIFIIMLLDIDKEENKHFTGSSIFSGVMVGLGFLALLFVVLMKSGVGFDVTMPPLSSEVGGKGNSDVHHIGRLLFSKYWFPVQVVGILLLVATVGVVVLSRKQLK